MENQRTIGRYPLACAALALLSACGAATVAVTPSPLRPMQMGITQVGDGMLTRYVYCEVSTCPSPSAKTSVLRTTSASHPPKAGVEYPPRANVSTSIDIAFPFNSPRMSDTDKNLLRRAAATHPRAHVEIIARSDFVGPPRGQLQVVAARAQAIRSLVAPQTQDAQVIERHEVADPQPVTKAEQARQRRGSVRFTPSIDVQPKGTIK